NRRAAPLGIRRVEDAITKLSIISGTPRPRRPVVCQSQAVIITTANGDRLAPTRKGIDLNRRAASTIAKAERAGAQLPICSLAPSPQRPVVGQSQAVILATGHGDRLTSPGKGIQRNRRAAGAECAVAQIAISCIAPRPDRPVVGQSQAVIPAPSDGHRLPPARKGIDLNWRAVDLVKSAVAHLPVCSVAPCPDRPVVSQSQ